MNGSQDVRDKQMTLVFSSYRLVEKQEKEKVLIVKYSAKLLAIILFFFSLSLLDSAMVDNVHVQTTQAREDAGKKK